MAKKHLGQNFLKSIKHINLVVSSAKVSSFDTVLEIGPGKGALTKKLLDTGAKVFAIEKDKDLIPFLSQKFEEEIKSGQFILLEDDALTFDLSVLPPNYKFVANIPFYITGAILERFLEAKNQPSAMSLIVQKEVAERIVVKDGKQSILSVSVSVFGSPKYVSKISARYFSPAPKVDSAILLIDEIKNPFKNAAEKDKFFKIVKTGFAGKRKTLFKNLLNLGISREKLEEIFAKLNLDLKIRAEKLSIKDWLDLMAGI
jgi:16S rRNA (adenine1518-N6/adenine1519-N6)-dimethyltransferase